MKNILRATTLLASLAALLAAPDGGTLAADKPKPQNRAAILKEIAPAVAASNNFGWALWPTLAKPSDSGNVLFCPPGAASVLTMCAAGANGQTRAELCEPLGLIPNSDFIKPTGALATAINASQSLDIASGIWFNPQFQIRPEYSAGMTHFMGATPQPLNASDPKASADAVNAWAQNKTAGKIAKVLSPTDVHSLTGIVLVNAVYFKCQWKTKFDKDQLTFRTSPEKTQQTDALSSTQLCNYATSDTFDFAQVLYADGRTLFQIILPKTPEAKPDARTLQMLVKAAKPTDIYIKIPKFTFDASYDLVPALQQLKVTKAFTIGADFSGMFKSVGGAAYVSKFVQSVYIQVDENGTEAAAVTAATSSIFATSTPQKPAIPTLIADRPFYFQIVNKETGAILFMGYFATPDSKAPPSP